LVNGTIITHEIIQLRIIAGLSWEQLATLLNAPQHQIRAWARGQLAPEQTKTHATATLHVLRTHDTGSAGENALRIHHHTKAFEHLCAQNYTESHHALECVNKRNRNKTVRNQKQ
jgi:hypothetical protein